MAMTKLQAVNIALDAIAVSAVNTLESGTEDAEVAERMLDETKQEVLGEGWLYNTRRTYLTKNNSNKFVVPGNALSVDTVEEHGYLDVINVGGYVYDKYKETDVWTTTTKLRVEIVYNYDFDDLPWPLQNYIARYNAVRFAKSQMMSVSLNSMIYSDYMTAKIKVLSDDNLKADPNAILDNPGAYAAMYRRNRYFGS